MRALYFDGGKLHYVDDHPAPTAGPDEAIVRVHLAGVCSTDLQVTPLIDATFPLAGGVDAVAHAAQPGVRKVLIAAG